MKRQVSGLVWSDPVFMGPAGSQQRFVPLFKSRSIEQPDIAALRTATDGRSWHPSTKPTTSRAAEPGPKETNQGTTGCWASGEHWWAASVTR